MKARKMKFGFLIVSNINEENQMIRIFILFVVG